MFNTFFFAYPSSSTGGGASPPYSPSAGLGFSGCTGA